MNLKEKIRVIEDYPKEGISFKDISTLLQDGPAFREAISSLAEAYRGVEVDVIIGPEARGFLIGAPLAYELKVGFVPVRKKGKLPGETISYEYELEYGVDTLEIHRDGIKAGQKVLVVDDLLATGGTIKAVLDLVEKCGGKIVGLGFLIELTELKGRENFANQKVTSLIKY
ncbi:adenine phosphoribosyltransferase [Desulfitispora alkaliphila]|uniref:adenine phosphoribosyltransferase n=1 Tax=Desulfitispora alkaliphila TaxID=622674 RepID=UPI003D222B10